jgi:hypothetical protein
MRQRTTVLSITLSLNWCFRIQYSNDRKQGNVLYIFNDFFPQKWFSSVNRNIPFCSNFVAYYIMWAYARCLSHLMYIFCIFMGDGIIIDNKQASKPWSSLSDRDLIWANDIPRCLKGAIRSGLNHVFALYKFYAQFKVFQK